MADDWSDEDEAESPSDEEEEWDDEWSTQKGNGRMLAPIEIPGLQSFSRAGASTAGSLGADFDYEDEEDEDEVPERDLKTPTLSARTPQNEILDIEVTGPLLGRGNYGSVMKGINHTYKCPTAVKIFDDEKEFEREMEVANAIGCRDGFSCVQASFEFNGRWYMVMRMANGDLESWMNAQYGVTRTTKPEEVSRTRFHRLTDNIKYKLIYSLVTAVGWLHDNKIAHRDVKPGNVLVYVDNGEVSFGLGDLGSVCATKRKEEAEAQLPLCPDTLEFVSTDDYVPPSVAKRVFRDRKPTYTSQKEQYWVDYWGLASCLYFVLTGTEPRNIREESLHLTEDVGPLSAELLNRTINTMLWSLSYKEAKKGFKELYHAVKQSGMHYSFGGITYHGVRFAGYNRPKATPGHPTKSHAVLAKEGNIIKLIRFGQQGVQGAGKHPKTEAERARRRSFKRRHAKNIAKGRMSAAYWADKVKW